MPVPRLSAGEEMTALLSIRRDYLSAHLEQGTLCRPCRGSGALSVGVCGRGQGHDLRRHRHGNSHVRDLLCSFIQKCFQAAYCVPDSVLIGYLTGGKAEVQRGGSLVSSLIHSAIQGQS